MDSKESNDVVYIGTSTLGHFMVFYFKDKASRNPQKTLCVPANTVAEAYQKLLMGDYYIKEER